MGDVKDIFYPAGISIVDYIGLFKKVYMREQSYALDRVSQKHLAEESWGDTSFGELNIHIKEKNINDVKRMMKLEAKFKLLDYYDEIRRSTNCLWEDLIFNSKVLDMMILKEAKKKNLVLPNKQQFSEESEELQGAYRRSDAGVFKNIYKADVGSMYPNQIINFCLDRQNIRATATENSIEIDGIHIEQNPDALIPFMARKLITQKDTIKKHLKSLKHGTDEYEHIMNNYNAIKALVNSLYGVTALSSFRLYNNTIASRITFLSRNLLQYVENKMQEFGYKVIYTDTDALMYNAEKDEIDLLNHLVEDWSIETYEKTDITIAFESEGMFTKILLLGKCHYYGYITDSKGNIKNEVKGLEMKRSSSSKFESVFQKSLIEKVLDEVPKTKITEWIKEEQKRIKTLPLTDIGFPCKITNKEYKNEPIFVRAYENTQRTTKGFHLNKGELFYYIYVRDINYDNKGKSINVMAFTEKKHPTPLRVDWDEIIHRSIINKADAIFEVLGWGSAEQFLSDQLTLF